MHALTISELENRAREIQEEALAKCGISEMRRPDGIESGIALRAELDARMTEIQQAMVSTIANSQAHRIRQDYLGHCDDDEEEEDDDCDCKYCDHSPEPEVVHRDRCVLPSVELLARALHLVDPDVLVFACHVGEASREPNGKKLDERGPAVIAVVEKMWELNEAGLRSKWIDVATRALAVMSPKP